MGVKGLWNVIIPAASHMVDLSDLRGQTVAVDVSTWIVEARSIFPAKQYNHYLR